MINRHIVSFSGGKDSTAMLLRMIEENQHIDDIIFVDTGLEFPELYYHIEQVEKYINRKITRLYPHLTYWKYIDEYYKKGYTAFIPRINARWCNDRLKMMPIRDYLSYYKYTNIIMYIGIAADEIQRVKPNKIYPLVKWGMTETDCLKYCYERGFDFGGLYKTHNRLGCWCCPLQSMKDKEILRYEYPHLWNKLKDIERTYNTNYFIKTTIEELENFHFPIIGE